MTLQLPKANLFVFAQNERLTLPDGAVQAMNLGEAAFLTGVVWQTAKDFHGRERALCVFPGLLDLDMLDGYARYLPKQSTGIFPMVQDIEVPRTVAERAKAATKMRGYRSKWPCGVYAYDLDSDFPDHQGPYWESVFALFDFVLVGLHSCCQKARRDGAALRRRRAAA